jgi:hypothetical protein
MAQHRMALEVANTGGFSTVHVKSISMKEDRVNENELRKLLGLSEDADLSQHLEALVEDSRSVSELRELMEIDENGDLIAAVKDELQPIREAQANASKEHQFAQMFPDEYARMQKLEARRVEDDAKTFAARYERFSKKDGDTEVKSTVGLPMVTVNKIAEMHQALSQRTASVKLFGELLDLIAKQGFVDFSERGSSIGEETADDPVKQFNSRVVAIMTNDSKNAREATRMAAAQYPAEYEAYREAQSAISKTTA